MDLKKRSREMKDFFNERIDEYDDLHLKIIKAKEKIVDFIPKDAKNIIDLGTSTGLQLIKVYKEFPNIKTIAIDVSDEMLKKLEDRHISDNITIVNESFFDYDFGCCRDAVISTQALHHFDPKDKLVLFKKIYDSLKEGGVFINEDYYVESLEEEKKGFDDYKNLVKGEGKHYDTPLTIEHEIELLKEAGFSNILRYVTDEEKIVVATK